MNRIGRKYRKSAHGVVAAVLLSFVFPAMAPAQQAGSDDSATSPFSDWACERCPQPEPGWSGMFDFGLGWISDDSLRYGNYRGLEEEGAYFPLDAEGRYRDAEGRYVDFRARDLTLDRREFEIQGGQAGRYELSLGWNEIPTWRGYGAQTPFQGQGSTELSLPAGWVHARTTGEMAALQSSLVPAPMKLQRKTLDAGARFRFSREWSVEVNAQRQDKSGTRPFGGAGVFYNNATQLLAPVDFTTDNVEVGINWDRETFHLSLGFQASEFDNGRNSLTWDNPFTVSAGVEQFRAALEPSNEFYQFSLTGAWAITPRIHLSGHAAVGEMSQDEAFLPYSINEEFDSLVLPRASLDGSVDTSVYNLAGKLFARINSRLSVSASAKYDERDNQTPVDRYTPVTADFIMLGERKNRPYGYERTQYSADARFRAFSKLRLGGGVRYKDVDRTLQAIENSDETTWWGEAKFTPLPMSHLRLTFEQAKRDTSEYEPVSESGRLDHPLFRKFNQADRDRNRGQLEAFQSFASGLGVNLTLYAARDDYNESVLGLQNSDVEGATLSLDYAVNTASSVYAFFSQEKIESDLFGRDGSQDWAANTKDRISTAGAGYSTSIEPDKQLGIDLIWADSKGDISVRTFDEAPFPALRTKLKNLRVHFSHDVSENWGYRIYAEYESFDSSDWAFDGIGVDGVDNVLTYGIISPRYDVLNLRAQATYHF